MLALRVVVQQSMARTAPSSACLYSGVLESEGHANDHGMRIDVGPVGEALVGELEPGEKAVPVLAVQAEPGRDLEGEAPSDLASELHHNVVVFQAEPPRG